MVLMSVQCQKAGRQLNALTGLYKYIGFQKLTVLYSQIFTIFPLCGIFVPLPRHRK